jgi:hypothetical protein
VLPQSRCTCVRRPGCHKFEENCGVSDFQFWSCFLTNTHKFAFISYRTTRGRRSESIVVLYFKLKGREFEPAVRSFQPLCGHAVHSASNTIVRRAWGRRLAPKADNFTAIYEPTVYKMRQRRRLVALRVSTALPLDHRGGLTLLQIDCNQKPGLSMARLCWNFHPVLSPGNPQTAMLVVSPCHHSMTRPRFADGRDGLQLEVSCEYIE